MVNNKVEITLSRIKKVFLLLPFFFFISILKKRNFTKQNRKKFGFLLEGKVYYYLIGLIFKCPVSSW